MKYQKEKRNKSLKRELVKGRIGHFSGISPNGEEPVAILSLGFILLFCRSAYKCHLLAKF
eukprot:5029049-Amphidinium_carterae.1